MPRWLVGLLKLILTVGVLGAIVTAVDPSALLASLREARWLWVAVAVLLLPINLALDGWVWRILLKRLVDRVSVRAVGTAVLSGMALGFWTPARVGEFAGRALTLPEGDRWTLSLSVFAQRMVDMAVGVLVGLGMLIWAFDSGVIPASPAWLTAAAVGAGAGSLLATFVAVPALVHRFVERLVPEWPSLTTRTVFLQRLSLRQRGIAVAGTVLRYAVFTGQLACLGAAFVPGAPFALLWSAAALTFFVKYLVPSLTVLDLGIREGSAAFFFHLLGLGTAAGVNAALLLFCLNVLVPAVLGAPLLTTLRLSPDEKAVAPSLSTLLTGS